MKKKKILWGFIAVISLIIFCVALMYVIKSLSRDSANDGSNFRDTGYNGEAFEGTDENGFAENHGINWKELKKTNLDTYAWIYIPDTQIDWPVVQPDNGEDDDFYLTRNIKKKDSSAGCIYSEMQNSKDFTDPITVLYGHNMADGSMFATLHKFENTDFFNQHEFMYIYTPGHKLTYEIYSAYKYDNRHILNSFDFSDKKVLLDYLKYTQHPVSTVANTRSLKKLGIKLGKNSKVLTLSTCTSNVEGDTRYIVQGVLLKDEPTE